MSAQPLLEDLAWTLKQRVSEVQESKTALKEAQAGVEAAQKKAEDARATWAGELDRIPKQEVTIFLARDQGSAVISMAVPLMEDGPRKAWLEVYFQDKDEEEGEPPADQSSEEEEA